MNVDTNEGKITWKLNGLECGCANSNMLNEENNEFVAFLEFSEVGLRVQWKKK